MQRSNHEKQQVISRRPREHLGYFPRSRAVRHTVDVRQVSRSRYSISTLLPYCDIHRRCSVYTATCGTYTAACSTYTAATPLLETRQAVKDATLPLDMLHAACLFPLNFRRAAPPLEPLPTLGLAACNCVRQREHHQSRSHIDYSARVG